MTELAAGLRAQSGHTLAVLTLLVAVCFLATGGIFVRLSGVEPIATGAYRILFALPFAYLWMRTEAEAAGKAPSPLGPARLVTLTAAGAFLGMDLVLWHVSFLHTTVANANLLANLVPFIVVPVAFLVFKERVSNLFFVGLAVTVAGVVVLMAGKLAPTADSFRGDALAMGTAVFYGLYIITISRLRKTMRASEIMLYSGFGSLLVLVPAALIFETNVLPTEAAHLLPLLGLALLSHIGGQGLLAAALGSLSASLSSVMVLSQPVIAAVYAMALFGEHLSPMEWAGILVTLAGIYIAKRCQ